MPNKKSSSTGLGCLCLFALPFASVGLFMAYLTVSALVDWMSMRSWVAVDAHLDAVGLARNYGSDSTTYEVTASYRYTYDGRDYVGSRVGLHTGSDNIGDYHEDIYAGLSPHRGKSFRCFVNPSSPSEAVLTRDLRVGLLGFYLLFVIVFGGAGVGMVAGGIYGQKKLKREEELQALHPDEPWLHHEDWHDGRIRSSTKAGFITAALFAGAWNVMTVPLVVLTREKIFDPDNRIALLTLLFPVIGVVLAVWAGRSFVRWRKFGESTLELSTIPGVIGGPVEGAIRTSVDVRPESGFDVVLSSIHRYRSGSGKNRTTNEKVLWQKSYRVGLDRSSGGIPIAFQVPYDCEATDVTDSDNQHTWKLEVRAEVRGVDYHAEFEVPVFRTEHSSPHPPEPSEVFSALSQVTLALAERLRAVGARVELLPAGKRFVFPMARNLGAAIGLTLFFFAWTAITAALWYSDAPRLFPWLFGFFDLLLFLGVLDTWFYSSRIEARPGTLSVASGLFAGRRRTWTRDDVAKVATKRGMQSGNKLFYQLEIHAHDGTSRVVAKRLPDLDTAERLAKEIDEILF